MPHAAPVWERTRVSAAAASPRNVATVTCPVIWTVGSSTPAVSLQTAWRSAWSAAAFASLPEALSQRNISAMHFYKAQEQVRAASCQI